MSSGISSASFLTDNDGKSSHTDDNNNFDTIPDERDWKRDVATLKSRVGDFNITNYVKKVLTEDEQAQFNAIIKKFPLTNQVYMQ